MLYEVITPRYAGELRPQAFHHDLAGAGQAIHLHRHRLLVGTQQDHRQGQVLTGQLGLLAIVQQLAEIAQRVALAGVLQTGLPVDRSYNFV